MGLNSLHRFNYESKLRSFVDSKLGCEWSEKQPDSIVLNQLYRLMKFDKLSDKIYDHIIANIPHTEKEICDWIVKKLKLTITTATTLQDLLNVSSKRSIGRVLLYNRTYVDIGVIRRFWEDLTQEELAQDEAPMMNAKKLSFDRAMYQAIFQVVSTYCTIGDMLRITATSRLWHENIMNKSFISQCEAFRTFKLGYHALDYWYYQTSSQWYLTNLQILHINVSKKQIADEEFPKFKHKTIQYLASNKFHLQHCLPHLKSLKISGHDNTEPMHWDCDREWQLQKQNDKPLNFVVVESLYANFYSFIPNSYAILFDNCNISNNVINYYLENNVTKWFGLQKCYLLRKPRKYIEPSSAADIMKYTPQISLILIYTEYFSRIQYFLSSNSIYDKYILNVQMVVGYYQINSFLIELLTFFTKIKNMNEPKSIVCLFHLHREVVSRDEANNEAFHVRDFHLWDWIKEYREPIQKNACIKKFVIGILRDWGDYKTADCFDINTTSAKEIIHHCGMWAHVLYNIGKPLSTVSWQNEFNQIHQSF